MTVLPSSALEHSVARRRRGIRVLWRESGCCLALAASVAVLPRTGRAASGVPAPEQSAAAAWLAQYAVAEGCPTEAAFVALVAERLSVSLDRARTGSRVRVEIRAEAASAARWVGRIQVTDAALPPSSREVAGPACGDVATALSLIAAISLEPDGNSSSSAELLAAKEAGPRLAGISEAAEAAAAARPGVREGVRVSASATVLTMTAATPRNGFGAGLEIGVETAASGVWAPLAQLGGYALVRRSVRVADDARARFSLVAAHALFCPLRFPSRGFWAVRPCIDVDVGQLEGAGAGPGVVDGRSKSGLWLSAGTGVQMEADVWGPLRLALYAAAVVPLARQEFYFGPDTLAFRVPALGARGAALVGVTF